MSDSPENRGREPSTVVPRDPRDGHRQSTLPPPEWTAPASVSSLALERWVKGHSTSRLPGPRAQLGEMEARLRVSVEKTDLETEHTCSKQLARALIASATQIDRAVVLARRALELQEDEELRSDLCSWYTGLGEAALAASVLRPLCESQQGKPAARTLTRMAVLLTRAANPQDAAAALRDASQKDPENCIALELLAAVTGFAPAVVSRAEAAQLYVQAFRLHEAGQDRAAAYEDLLRAFEASPASAEAAALLCEVHTMRGRTQAADEVLRQHGEALAGPERAAVNEQRWHQALADRDWPRALAAGFDAGLDAVCELQQCLSVVQARLAGEPLTAISHFDALLAELGLFEMLSARLELSALRGPRERRGEILGYLASFRASCSLSPGSPEADDAVRIARAQLVEGEAIAAMTTLFSALPDDRDTGRAAGILWSIAAEQAAGSARAAALTVLAGLASGTVASVLHSVSSEGLRASGDQERALQEAAAACHAEPGSARAMVTYAEAALGSDAGAGSGQRVIALSLERAMALSVPRVHLCRQLGLLLEQLKEPAEALTWTQRWLALAPGDTQALRAVLRRAIAAQDAKRLSDALTWILAQPQPHEGLHDDIALALRALARLDAKLGSAAARRVLDTFGARVDSLRAVLVEVAEWLGERRLVIAVLERKLASGAVGEERSSLLLELVRRRREAADADGAARTLLRALLEGVGPKEIEPELQLALPPLSSDGRVAMAQLKAELATLDSTAAPDVTAAILRAYGAAVWDLIGDQETASAIWERAALLDRRQGMEQLRRDFLAFGGPAFARNRLIEVADRCSEAYDKARVLALVAGLAIDAGDRKAAFGHAREALAIDPRRADALALAERSAMHEDLGALVGIYEAALQAQLGCYGVRALSYRAARKLERWGEVAVGFHFAQRAFEAVPADGVTLALMLRLAEQCGDIPAAVQVIDRVAEGLGDSPLALHWRLRAKEVLSRADGGSRRRVEDALVSVSQAATAENVRALGSALTDWVLQFPEEREVAGRELDEVARRLLPSLTTPDHAEVALAIAQVVLEGFPQLPLCVEAACLALRLDASLEDFTVLLRYVPELANVARAAELPRQCLERVQNAQGPVAPVLVDLAHKIFTAVGDEEGAVRALVIGSRREPSNAELYGRAAAAAWALGNRDLLRLLDTASVGSREPHVLKVALALQENGDLDRAIAVLEPAHRAALLDEADLRQVRNELGTLYRQAGKHARLGEFLAQELALLPVSDESYRARVLELSELYISGKQPGRALTLLRTTIQRSPRHVSVIDDALRLARSLGDDDVQQQLLLLWAELETDPALRGERLRELAQLTEQTGERKQAEAAWERVLEQQPNDAAALTALSRLAEERQDWSALVQWLGRRRAIEQDAASNRVMGLYQAQLLENKLQRSAEAERVLQELLSDLGDGLEVLRAQAEFCERAGEHGRAASLWEKASGYAADQASKEDLLLRACHALIHVGDEAGAQQILSLSGPLSGSLAAASLRVAVERRSGNPIGLARALEELAVLSSDAPEQRASLLLEAARMALHSERLDLALAMAHKAIVLLPGHAQAELLAALIEYRERGPGSTAQAREMATVLRHLSGRLSANEDVLRRFLLAEALETAEGPGIGLREIKEAHDLYPHESLIALGLAERLQRGGDSAAAFPLFEQAVQGDLQHLRSRGRVFLQAARAAERGGDLERAEQLLRSAQSLQETSVEADRRLLELQSIPPSKRPQQLPEPPQPDRTVSQFNRASFSPLSDADRSRPAPRTLLFGAKRRPSGSLEVSPVPPAVLPPPPPSKPLPPSKPSPVIAVGVLAAPEQPAAAIDSSPTIRSEVPSFADEAVSVEESVPLVRPSVRASARSPALLTPQPVAVTPRPAPATFSSEVDLRRTFNQGDLGAGVDLVSLLRQEPARSRDLVQVCRQLCDAQPGDVSLLALLHDSACRDGDMIYARALEHALGVFRGSFAADPPPLADQVEQPGEIASLLFHPTRTAAGDVLGMIWQWAGPLFWQEPAKYSVTGVERVTPTAPTPLGQACLAATRALGMLRTPVFHKRSSATLTITPAALNPPALVLEGDVGDVTAELCYWLGVALCATLPDQVLLATAPAEQVEDILRAAGAAFGPPNSNRAGLATVAQLAGGLWERIPAREQRRLSALCLEQGALDRQTAVEGAQQAARRAGLFVCGDLFYALGALCSEEGIDPATMTPEAYKQMCARRSQAADLARLATSPEYAAARWQNPRPNLRHSSRPGFHTS